MSTVTTTSSAATISAVAAHPAAHDGSAPARPPAPRRHAPASPAANSGTPPHNAAPATTHCAGMDRRSSSGWSLAPDSATPTFSPGPRTSQPRPRPRKIAEPPPARPSSVVPNGARQAHQRARAVVRRATARPPGPRCRPARRGSSAASGACTSSTTSRPARAQQRRVADELQRVAQPLLGMQQHRPPGRVLDPSQSGAARTGSSAVKSAGPASAPRSAAQPSREPAQRQQRHGRAELRLDQLRVESPRRGRTRPAPRPGGPAPAARRPGCCTPRRSPAPAAPPRASGPSASAGRCSAIRAAPRLVCVPATSGRNATDRAIRLAAASASRPCARSALPRLLCAPAWPGSRSSAAR